MSLYHGTSAASALKILQSGKILPSRDGYFYCFDAAKPESLAGALCFATGDGPRNGSLTGKDFFSQYVRLNPDFPRGVKGMFAKTALKMAAHAWADEQMKSASGPLDRCAAILVYRSHPDAVARSRGGFVNETVVPEKSLGGLVLERVYVDDALLKTPEFEQLAKQGISLQPLSACADAVRHAGVAPKARGPAPGK